MAVANPRVSGTPATGSTHGAAAVERLMRPRSVAIVGISSKPGSAGHTVLANLTVNKYAGDIHLVGRSGGTIDGRPVLASVDDLPEGVDLAVFTLPAAGVKEALEGCVRRKVRAATVFASGFAEAGNRPAQEELSKIAEDGGIAMLGPNCLGYTNFVDGLQIGFASAAPVAKLSNTNDPALAIISQSGGFMAHLRQAFEGRNLPTSYTVSPGNEGGLDLVDFVEFLTQDKATKAIVLYAEDVRRPAEFLAAAKAARAAGKPVILMHPGSSVKGQAATASHTGALAGNYAVMRTQVAHAGIALVETLDELADTAEILARYPEPPTKGPGILTFSGAFCAIAHDFCEAIGFDLPPLSKVSEEMLKKRLPSFVQPHNPLDLTTQPIWEPDLVGYGAKALLDDPALGSLVISITVGGPEQSVKYMKGLIEAIKGINKPVVFSVLGDTSPLAPEFLALAKEHKIIISRSSERSIRAMAKATAHGLAVEAAKKSTPATPVSGLPKLGSGTQAEWLGKQVFAAAGIPIPEGGLAKTVDEAVQIAKKIGYPVVLKAQAAALAHKTEAGGVLLNIADEAALKAAWTKLYDNVGKHAPNVKLDGALVEKMSSKGLELVVGAKRDPQWGPIVLIGLGGILVEALGDVRLLPADLSEDAIVAELHKLKAAKVLGGFRGQPPVDVKAVAKIAATIGRLMRTMPEIVEIDVNPLIAHAQGVTALDALIVTK
jgi:acyl-CoA synthetase (NDP forming)